MHPIQRDLFSSNANFPKSIFKGVKAVWVVDGCDTATTQLLKTEVMDRSGYNFPELLSGQTTHIIAIDWGAVIMKWSWRWINYVMSVKGVAIVDLEWVKDSLDANCLQDVDDYAIYIPWKDTRDLIIEKCATDRMLLPNPELYPFVSTIRRVLFEDMEKSIFQGVKAIFVETGIAKSSLEHYRRTIIEHQGELHEKLTIHTTHLVTKIYTDACVKFGVCDIRMKHANNGMWVISPRWVQESLSAGHLVYEGNCDEYEMAVTSYTP
jgi:hypothetical protein